jgi:hypothetical protein
MVTFSTKENIKIMNEMIGRNEATPGIVKQSVSQELSIACDKANELHKILTEFEKMVEGYINQSNAEVNKESEKAMISPFSPALNQAKQVSYYIDSAISRILALERRLEL